MIKIENLNKYFNRHRSNQVHVINNTSLTFEDKGMVALLGPSGSGKTTLLNVIGGLDKVKSGSIYINNQKMTSRFTYKKDKIRNLNIGYIFQDYKLVENLSVYDNVALVLKMLGVKDKKIQEDKIKYVLESVGMWRYRKRPASMLSGGQRQRVGIARAIVKNPNIIIADEPTGNLDSRNTIEIMNIIKAISKERLVILVTHEVNLAKFYATRIIEIADGSITNDYLNTDNDKLEIMMDNCFYLKDFKNNKQLKKDNLEVNVYSDKNEELKLNIVIKNNNIYIENANSEKIEVVDNESSINFYNEHHKKIDKSTFDKYKFNLKEDNLKLKYCSIFNPFTFISNGFKQLFNYPFMKKILLIGFFLSGMFIMLGTSRIAANINVRDSDFIKSNKNYLIINTKKISIDDYYKYKSSDLINYLFPGDGEVRFTFLKDDIYQSLNYNIKLQGSLSSTNMLESSDIISGKIPQEKNEVVVDKMVVDKFLKEDLVKMMGIKRKDVLNSSIKIPLMDEFKIVGVVDMMSPSIYVNEDNFINILYNMNNDESKNIMDEVDADKRIQDYNLYNKYVTLKEGNFPVNDYEVIVNITHKNDFKLNKEIEEKINDKKLKVVGYYTSKYDIDNYLVNNNMVLQKLIVSSKDITIYPKDKEETINGFREDYDVNIVDSYQNDKDKYLEDRKDATKIAIISSIIIIGISLVEIFLMLRASFLSRVKEVGIYRAIGVKKRDIYIMFSGEIIAITTIANVSGIILSYYILSNLCKIEVLKSQLMINPLLFMIAVGSIYLFNLLVGLVPVFNTLRKTPAQILARTDVS